MSRKLVLLTALITVLVGTLGLAFKVQRVEASGTIYIRADGSIDPPDAPIITFDNVTYTLTDNVISSADGIVVERENIVIDGAGYTIKGPGKYLSAAWGLKIKMGDVTITNVKIKECGIGIYVHYVKNVMIYNNTVSNDFVGIEYSGGENSTISNNVFLNVSRGIVIDNSANNVVISGNNISAYEYGILIGPIEGYSVNNVISCNIISDADAAICLMHNNNNKIVYNIFLSNNQGIRVIESNNNLFFHNNFINNLHQVHDPSWENPSVIEPSINVWDDGYPSGGNYWSDYTGVDSDRDGIGDDVHVIDANNTDNYPLKGVFSDFKVVTWGEETYHVNVISNSTISDFDFEAVIVIGEPDVKKRIKFNVIGENDTGGFCRVCIPTALMNDTYTVFVNGTKVPHTLLPCSNSTHSYTYFCYEHSTKEVVIVPEFPSFLILSLFMIATLVVVIVYNRKHQTHNEKRGV